MAIKRSDKFKAALFLFVTLGLFVTMIVALIGTSWMHKRDTYFIDFSESVRGLKPGAPVRYHGEEVGSVQTVKYRSEDGVARVTIAVTPHIVIRTNSLATLEVDSLIIGNQYIEITPGTPNIPELPPHSTIPSALSKMDQFKKNVQSLSGKMQGLIQNVNNVFAPQNAAALSSILYQVDVFMETNSTAFTHTMREFRETLTVMNDMLRSANNVVIQNQRVVAQTLANMQQATYTLNELLEKINRQPAVLLHGQPQPEDEWNEE